MMKARRFGVRWEGQRRGVARRHGSEGAGLVVASRQQRGIARWRGVEGGGPTVECSGGEESSGASAAGAGICE